MYNMFIYIYIHSYTRTSSIYVTSIHTYNTCIIYLSKIPSDTSHPFTETHGSTIGAQLRQGANHLHLPGQKIRVGHLQQIRRICGEHPMEKKTRWFFSMEKWMLNDVEDDSWNRSV